MARAREKEGQWFKSVPPGEYLTRYEQVLAELDPAEVASQLAAITGGRPAFEMEPLLYDIPTSFGNKRARHQRQRTATRRC